MFRGATYQLGTTAPPLPPNSFVPERTIIRKQKIIEKKKQKKNRNHTQTEKKVKVNKTKISETGKRIMKI